MKKHIVAIVLVASLTMAGVASANWGRGGGYGGGGNCPQMQGPMMQGAMMQQLDPETRAKVSKFFKDNQALHKQMAMKQAENRAIIRSEKPDPQAAAKVAGELFDLRTAMFEKAEAAGVSQYLGPMGGPMGGGRGFRGQGRGAVGGPGMGANAAQQ
ncbi:MAG: periplasmic heavy metal sensor [Pseudomonadota bacterium]